MTETIAFDSASDVYNPVLDTVDWLQSLGLPPIPVAPAQSPERYPQRDDKGNIKKDKNGNSLPLFTGKNPSYLDAKGIPQVVMHHNFQKMLPSDIEIKEWFSNPETGIGTLGGWHKIIWLDIDAKDFDSIKHCEIAVEAWLNKHPELRETTSQRTQGGGYRFGVIVENIPSFTNFAMSPQGKKVGEAIGQGRFAILAPTIGVTGNAYKIINNNHPVTVRSLESIDIYSTKSCKQSLPLTLLANSSDLPLAALRPQAQIPERDIYLPPGLSQVVSLEKLLSPASARILRGEEGGDRSSLMTTFIKECWGWKNWCSRNGVLLDNTEDSLINSLSIQLNVDGDKLQRIKASIDESSCEPACLRRGTEANIWLKIRKLNYAVFAASSVAQDWVDDETGTARPKLSGRGVSSYFGSDSSQSSSKKTEKFTPYDAALAIITEDNPPLWLYDKPRHVWRVYNGMFWEEYDTYSFEQVVFNYLHERGINFEKHSLLVDLINIFRCNFLSRTWEPMNRDRYIAFGNGVLDFKTGEFAEFHPSQNLTAILPQKYKPIPVIEANQSTLTLLEKHCPKFWKYANKSLDGDSQRILKMVGIGYAILTQSLTKWQKFVFLQGASAGGKGVFSEFLQNLVGKENSFSFDIRKLDDQHYVSAFIGKQMIFDNDADRIMENFGSLKKLVGRDPVPFRKLYGQPCSAPFFGSIVVSANFPFIEGTKTEGVDRRPSVLEFKTTIPKDERIEDLAQQLVAEIEMFTSICLLMGHDKAKSIVCGLGNDELTGMAHLNWTNKVQTNSVAEWMNSSVIYQEGENCRIGDKNLDGSAYKHYVESALALGRSPVSHVVFSNQVLELCKSLKWDCGKKKEHRGMVFTNLRLRLLEDNALWIEELLVPSSLETSEPLSTQPTEVESVAIALIETVTLTESAPVLRTVEAEVEAMEDNLFAELDTDLPVLSERLQAVTTCQELEVITIQYPRDDLKRAGQYVEGEQRSRLKQWMTEINAKRGSLTSDLIPVKPLVQPQQQLEPELQPQSELEDIPQSNRGKVKQTAEYPVVGDWIKQTRSNKVLQVTKQVGTEVRADSWNISRHAWKKGEYLIATLPEILKVVSTDKQMNQLIQKHGLSLVEAEIGKLKQGRGVGFEISSRLTTLWETVLRNPDINQKPQ